MYYKISSYITGFRKCYGMQHSLLFVLENWRKTFDKEGNACTMIMGLYKINV